MTLQMLFNIRCKHSSSYVYHLVTVRVWICCSKLRQLLDMKSQKAAPHAYNSEQDTGKQKTPFSISQIMLECTTTLNIRITDSSENKWKSSANLFFLLVEHNSTSCCSTTKKMFQLQHSLDADYMWVCRRILSSGIISWRQREAMLPLFSQSTFLFL